MFNKLFRDHPASIQETYGQHFRHAMGFSIALFRAAIACFIHALIPGLCIKTGSRAITQLHQSMVTFRVKNSDNHRGQNDCDNAPEYMI